MNSEIPGNEGAIDGSAAGAHQLEFEEVLTQLELSPDKIKEEMSRLICEKINIRHQPGPGELLQMLEEQIGWQIRQFFLEVIRFLREEMSITGYSRDYFQTTLSDEALETALKGDSKSVFDSKSTLDELFRNSKNYRQSKAFQDLIDFAAKFRDYAPFNNLLVKIQNPSCSFYATARDWGKRFERTIKEDARPLLILAPMHPVMLVYDLDSTEGPPLPQQLLDFARVDGEWNPEFLTKILKNAERDLINVKFAELSSTRGGFATTFRQYESYKMRVVVNSSLEPRSRFSVLCHELAHIYLGHLGSDSSGFWPCRINLSHAGVEIEAEAVAFIVAQRLGLRSCSEAYISSYLKDGIVPETVSIELITKVSNKIEEMSRGLLPARKKGADSVKEK